MEYITVECGVGEQHDPHSWREGFLWHRKRECRGVPHFIGWSASGVMTPNESRAALEYCEADERYTSALYKKIFHPEPHRHKFVIDETSNWWLIWRCDECPEDAAYIVPRFIYVAQTVYGRRLEDNPKTL